MADGTPAPSEALLDAFGQSSWVLLPAAPVRAIAAELGADVVDDAFAWGENPHLGEGGGVLVLTAAMNGWMLLHGASETVGAAAAELSERRDVYRAMIDVRLPAMSWAYLEAGMPVRSVSLELGDEGDLVARTAGDPLPFERDGALGAGGPHGLDSFLYPMAILGEHGVTLDELERGLDRPSVTLRIR
ncbi:hypothetical protein [Leifsonia aquatica]|uniref:hypothetical protein n=1 Tax=Leifsonia aquatica TaxID=144185 RepID=UPI000468CB85|nr:hypothetical protein [Leifsonia aquatica]